MLSVATRASYHLGIGAEGVAETSVHLHADEDVAMPSEGRFRDG